ncbi:TetR/AcrR family transcriptional regulator [bacterium]|nr:TetR/AcrR family transcriptional regulator [bacterium]
MALRKSRQDWIEAGLSLLRSEGQQALTIERLAQSLEVTKGSFYHHFGNLANYHQALLDWWQEVFTHQPMRQAEEESDPVRQSRRLTQVVRELDYPLELALRAWGLRDARVAEAIGKIDRLRLDCLESLHRQQGHAQVKILAYLEYTAFIGGQLIRPAPEGATRALQQALELWRKL